jgi:hypothetical protein
VFGEAAAGSDGGAASAGEIVAIGADMDALRTADGALMTTDEIAGQLVDAKGFDAADAALRKAIGDQVLTLLRSFRKRRTVEQIGLGRGVQWKSTRAE